MNFIIHDDSKECNPVPNLMFPKYTMCARHFTIKGEHIVDDIGKWDYWLNIEVVPSSFRGKVHFVSDDPTH